MAATEKRNQHFDDSLPLSCFIETSHCVKDHVEYNIRVQRGPFADNSWLVTRRYNDFAVLDGQLSQSGMELPLPPKRMFGNMEREFIVERQQKLQEYLTALSEQPLLSASSVVKKFLDPKNYSEKLQEVALQHVSMHFRSEPGWEVVEPLPDFGTRLRKQYFLVRSVTQASKSREVMYWTDYGPYLNMPEKELTTFLKSLSNLNHPLIYPVTMATGNLNGVMVMRPYSDRGSLRDHICKMKPKAGSYLKKYGRQKQYQALSLMEVMTYGRQILEALKFLQDKLIPYGHLHTGNVMLQDNHVRLSDMENSVLGLPSWHRPIYCQLKRIQSVESCDVYNFGHVLYEMNFGEPLYSQTLAQLPTSCPRQIGSILESLLSKEAIKNGLPTIADLLANPMKEAPRGLWVDSSRTQIWQIEAPSRIAKMAESIDQAKKTSFLRRSMLKQCSRFFSSVTMPSADHPSFKIPSKVKESLKAAREHVETRLKEDQRMVNQVRRRSKAQAMHEEEEKKNQKKRKSKIKRSSTLNDTASRTDDDMMSTTSSVRSTSPPAPPAPAPPPPPPVAKTNASPLPKSSAAPGRGALLSSICAFSKNNLNKADTNDRSAARVD